MVVIDNSERPNNKKEPFLYGFHLFRTQKCYHMFTDQSDLFISLKEKLIYKTIQHTFHEEYEVKKLIGKGSFAKVKKISNFFFFTICSGRSTTQ